MPKTQISKQIDGLKIRTLNLVLTKNCNLNCLYCYEKEKQQDEERMDTSIAKEMIRKYMNADDEFNVVEIDFFGGEPMLAFSQIREIIQWFLLQNWSKGYRFLIGTNGTILTDEMKSWLHKYRDIINISLSIDGNKIAHDLIRDNSYDLIYPNLSFFKSHWLHQPAKMTIIGDTIPYLADSIIELEEMGINFTANVAFEDFWGNSERKKKLLNIYEEQLNKLVSFYTAHQELFPVSPLLTALPEYLGLSNSIISNNSRSDCVRFCGAGHEMVTVDIDGEVYPCHRFLPWVTGKPAPKLQTNIQTLWKPEECSNCRIVSSCPTCAAFNWEVNGDTSIRSTYHCESHILEVLASSKLEAIRLSQINKNKLESISSGELKLLKRKTEALWELIENGI